MGARSRNKGKAGEREIAAEIRAVLAIDVHRGWQSRAGTDACDVEGLPGAWLEVKRGKLPNVRRALTQATQDSDGRVPVAVVRDDGEDAFAVMSLDALLALFKLAMLSANGQMSVDLPAAFAAIRRARRVREADERARRNEQTQQRKVMAGDPSAEGAG